MGTGGLFLRKLRARVSDEPTGFVWVESGKLAASGFPASRGQVEWVVKSGIRSILTLTEDPLPAEFTAGLDLVSFHVRMEDHAPPTPDAMKRAVEFVASQVSAGRPVLVHCLAGEGRTGCVIAGYMIETRGLGPEKAIAVIREIKREFVERGQERAVREFAERPDSLGKPAQSGSGSTTDVSA